jgi:DNA gyrase subunit A
MRKRVNPGKRAEFLVDSLVTAGTGDLLVFTRRGEVTRVKAREVTEDGVILTKLAELPPRSEVAAVVPVEEFREDAYVVIVTKRGQIQRSTLATYSNVRRQVAGAIKLKPGDEVLSVMLTNGRRDLLLVSSEGKALRFSEEELRPTGRDTQGVGAISLRGSAVVVSGVLVQPNEELLVLTEKGVGKRCSVNEFPVQGRNVQGVQIGDTRAFPVTGPIAAVAVLRGTVESVYVQAGEEWVPITVADVRQQARATKGVPVIDTAGYVVTRIVV